MHTLRRSILYIYVWYVVQKAFIPKATNALQLKTYYNRRSIIELYIFQQLLLFSHDITTFYVHNYSLGTTDFLSLRRRWRRQRHKLHSSWFVCYSFVPNSFRSIQFWKIFSFNSRFFNIPWFTIVSIGIRFQCWNELFMVPFQGALPLRQTNFDISSNINLTNLYLFTAKGVLKTKN